MNLVGKLVRDNIPDIIRADNETPVFHICEGDEYTEALENKLNEEVTEYEHSKELVELADILEVVEALAENQGSTFDEVLKLKAEKQKKNGAFDKRYWLERIVV